MTWEYEYDGEANETVIYWRDDEQATIEGEITRWQNGYPASEAAREAIADVIQEAGTPDRIRMQYDFNYGFSDRNGEQP